MSKINKVFFVFVPATLWLATLGCAGLKPSAQQKPAIEPDIYTQDAQWRPKVDALVATLESKRKEYHIPGMAIAVVHGDDLLLAKGFGVSNLESQAPVSPRTTFAIGSSTKAFTSTIIGMLVDEGKMAWDDPIEKYLPSMKLKPDSENNGDAVTLRDMLSHRSGFTRMGILWASGESSREDILKDASNAQPWEGFRKGFFYNNVMYLGAGVAAGKAAGMDWDELLETRLLAPLNMKAANTTYAQAQADPHFSSGYLWNTETKTYDHLPMRNIDNIAPAGAINANVLDMTHWLRFQLAGGQFAGKRLISQDALMETRQPQIEVPDGASAYGMGWFLQSWQDQKVVQHGGNIDGFSAMVCLVPESDLGFVLLTNSSSSPLQNLSVNLVLDHLLGKTSSGESSGASQKEANDFQPYLGDYLADFGPFENATLKVLTQNGKLAVDVPGQTVYELKPENEAGKWVFEITGTIAVSFEKNEAGEVTLMRLHQGGLDFELPRKGFPIEPEIDPGAFTKYLGSYYSERHKMKVSVFIKNHRLTLKMGNQPVDFELHLPDEEGRRRFRIRESSHVVFNTNSEGAVVSVSRYRDGELKEVMKRVDAEEIPSLEDLEALRKFPQRQAAIARLGVFRLDGTITFLHAGAQGKASFTAKGLDRYLLSMDLGKYGRAATFATPERAATVSSFQPYEEYHGKYLDQTRKGNFGIAFMNWHDLYDSVQVVGLGTHQEKKVALVRLSGGGAMPSTLYVDLETGDVLKQDLNNVHPVAGPIATTILFSDYRDVQGLRIPFEVRTRNIQVGEIRYAFETIETHLDLADSGFVLEKPGASD